MQKEVQEFLSSIKLASNDSYLYGGYTDSAQKKIANYTQDILDNPSFKNLVLHKLDQLGFKLKYGKLALLAKNTQAVADLDAKVFAKNNLSKDASIEEKFNAFKKLNDFNNSKESYFTYNGITSYIKIQCIMTSASISFRVMLIGIKL